MCRGHTEDMRSTRALVAAVLSNACAGGCTDWLQVTHAAADPAGGVARLGRLIRAVASAVTAGVDKTGHLRRLRRALLQHIEEQVETRWPETPTARVDFPSAESALMSISFLTFAVFLVKLVLQVIQTYKSKAALVTPVLAAMGRARARAAA